MKIFNIPFETAPRWKFIIARIFGKTIHKDDGWLFKKWRGVIWVFGREV